jgi:hypothetical protein
LRVGQVTFCTSARTSCRNLNGLIFGIFAKPKRVFPAQLEGRDRQAVPLGEYVRRGCPSPGRWRCRVLTAGRADRQGRGAFWQRPAALTQAVLWALSASGGPKMTSAPSGLIAGHERCADGRSGPILRGGEVAMARARL